jgi:uncharacterized protein (DUF1778 family)
METATEQIHLRTLKKDKRLIARAAKATGRRNLTDYIMTAVLERAQVDLADRPRLALRHPDFQQFLARLDEPPRFLSGLQALLNTPAVFEPAVPIHGFQDGAAVADAKR